MILLVFPFQAELDAFLGGTAGRSEEKIRGQRVFSLEAEPTWRLAVCGQGKVEAALACQSLSDALDPRAVMLLGSATALDPSLRVGDIVLADPGVGLAVSGDATLLGRAIANLLENAQHHGAGVTRVTLTTERRLIWIGVHDRGPGFEEGERQSAARAEAKIPRAGLGLGLSLVRRIAAAHGGSLSTSRSPDGGALVAFSVRCSDSGEPVG